jgi:type VI secretion system protein ImpF
MNSPANLSFPCTLDRLLQPSQRGSDGQKDWISPRQYRDAVLRDLKWLLNSPQYPDFQKVLMRPSDEDLTTLHDRDDELRTPENRRGYYFPQARTSVLNYGARSFAGLSSQGLDVLEIEREIKEVLLQYEPRLIPSTISVKMARESVATGSLEFTIKAQLWFLPRPEPIQFRTRHNLDSGSCTLIDQE